MNDYRVRLDDALNTHPFSASGEVRAGDEAAGGGGGWFVVAVAGVVRVVVVIGVEAVGGARGRASGG